MRLLMTMTCLVVTLCTPLLRLVEVAGDFARVLESAASVEAEDNLEAPDGSLDDDDREVALRSRRRRDASDLGLARGILASYAFLLAFLSALARPVPGAFSRASTRSPWPTDVAGRRLAWLQHFRF